MSKPLVAFNTDILDVEICDHAARFRMEKPSATLYILRTDVDDLYKIGRTKCSLERRVSQLNTGAARKLKPIASFSVPSSLVCKCEAFVHASLRDISAPEAGGKEFFRCTEEEALKRRVHVIWDDFLKFSAEVQGAIEDKSKLAGIFAARRGLAAETKRLEFQKTLIDEAILPVFEEGYHVEGMQLLSWSKRSCERFDLAAFRREHPELAAQYTRTCVTRMPVFH
jgi:hypothetical protein